MLRHIRGLGVAAVCTMMLIVAPGVAVADGVGSTLQPPTTMTHSQPRAGGSILEHRPANNGAGVQATTQDSQDYGSIAYSPSTRMVVAGFGGSGESAATAAVQQCWGMSGSHDCWAVNWFYNGIGAFARASDSKYGS